MASEKGFKKEKNQNIQVFVRLRPLNQRERDIKSLGVIDVVHNREVIVRQSQNSHTKKFTYDRAFGPNAKQVEVYQAVVSPLIVEVLNGYNCTVFAYGQTGTGKTHTMVGENSGDATDWQSDPLAGIIPRALSQLFDELRISNTEYTVRVSYLELYNEELFDLLSSSEDNSKLRIYEDVTRKGSNIVNGLEEITVYDKNEVYKIMAQGQERKRVASTLMNAQSSRSHTVFTIVVHMKENSPEGEELVKIGKLNLVDLAGSENISKAGSDNPAKKERARECVNINQSLLTLGRVITALVERHPHIPYRESKLTRILQESLGGRTKTSIIATVSPGHKDLEETMSTLEYAYRAKNIQNKPEVNQKMTKRAILQEYAEEVDRLKRDLQAAREKNGIYIAPEDFTELTLKQEDQRKEIQELLLKKRAMEEERDKMENIFSDLSKTLEKRMSELNATKSKLSSTKSQLSNTNSMLHSTKLQFEETAHIVAKQQATEVALSQQAKQLLATADVATHHVARLHDTVDKRRHVESTNLQITEEFRRQSSAVRGDITEGAAHFTQALLQQLNHMHSDLENFASTNTETVQDNNSKLEALIHNIVETIDKIKLLTNDSQSKLLEVTESHHTHLKSALESHHRSVEMTLGSLLQSIASCVHSAENENVAEKVANFVKQWHTGACDRVSSLHRSHAAFHSWIVNAESTRSEEERTHCDNNRAIADQRADETAVSIAKSKKRLTETEEILARRLTSVESERQQTEDKLRKWEEREMQRIQEHLKSEREDMERRLAIQYQYIEEDKANVASIVTEIEELQQQLAQIHNEHLQRHHDRLAHTERGRDQHLATVSTYVKEFGEGTSAIGTDMEVFSSNVVEVCDHIYTELLRTLVQAKEQIQKDTQGVLETDMTTNKEFLEVTDSALNQLSTGNKDIMDNIVTNIEANNKSTIDVMASVAAAISTVISSSQSQCSAHSTAVHELQCQAGLFCDRIQEAIRTHQQLEDRYLREEYKVYEPTGATPNRMEYRYPRALAATSPHDRILERFRRARRHTYDEECVLIESDPESEMEQSGEGDSESTVSEAEVPVFAAPSPPAPTAPPSSTKHNGHHIPMVKCTSESDIYAIKRKQEQGKENTDSSMTYKKPSKLPAPSASHKKPLVARNNY